MRARWRRPDPCASSVRAGSTTSVERRGTHRQRFWGKRSPLQDRRGGRTSPRQRRVAPRSSWRSAEPLGSRAQRAQEWGGGTCCDAVKAPAAVQDRLRPRCPRSEEWLVGVRSRPCDGQRPRRLWRQGAANPSDGQSTGSTGLVADQNCRQAPRPAVTSSTEIRGRLGQVEQVLVDASRRVGDPCVAPSAPRSPTERLPRGLSDLVLEAARVGQPRPLEGVSSGWWHHRFGLLAGSQPAWTASVSKCGNSGEDARQQRQVAGSRPAAVRSSGVTDEDGQSPPPPPIASRSPVHARAAMRYARRWLDDGLPEP